MVSEAGSIINALKKQQEIVHVQSETQHQGRSQFSRGQNGERGGLNCKCFEVTKGNSLCSGVKWYTQPQSTSADSPPAAAMRIALQPSEETALLLAPDSRRAFTAAEFPDPAAHSNGVPVDEVASLSAPACKSASTTFPEPAKKCFDLMLSLGSTA